MTDAERISVLEGKVSILEARIALLSSSDIAPRSIDPHSTIEEIEAWAKWRSFRAADAKTGAAK